MGVRGLTTYISENSKLYLKPYNLRDCHLVVDGNNVACKLYLSVCKRDSVFGGDYDEYYKAVSDFFKMLQKCKVKPIVLFDGGYEKKKMKTVLRRVEQKLTILRTFKKGYSKARSFPLFLKDVFLDVMNDLKILCIQCDFEADIEIASVARALNCPVLSYDSDFYIFDVLYIPFSSVYSKPVQDSEHKYYYVRCAIYDLTNFLRITGIDKSVIPILATLLGNDIIDSSIFGTFFNHVAIPKSSKSCGQRWVQGVLHWLKNENVESAIELILLHIKNANRGKALKAISLALEEYTDTRVSNSVIEKITKEIGNVNLSKKESVISLPEDIINLFYEGRISKHVVDMLTRQTYVTAIQVEDVYGMSSHRPSLPLIKAIYSLLSSDIENQSNVLKLYLVIRNHYHPQKVVIDSSFSSLSKILEGPQSERLQLLYEIVGVNKHYIKSILNENEDWIIFVISLIYWISALRNSVTFAHIHALILMAIANLVVQKRVGYFKLFIKYKKSMGPVLLNNKEITVSESKNFDELLANITIQECWLVQSKLIPFRCTIEEGQSKGYSISVIHTFSCFQSCLYHIMQLNALFNQPLPHMKISDLYSGTLLFNLYLRVKGNTNVDKFTQSLFENAPNLANLYDYLFERFCTQSGRAPPVVKKQRKKKGRKNKAKKEVPEMPEEIVFNSDEAEDVYEDESNPYFALHSATSH